MTRDLDVKFKFSLKLYLPLLPVMHSDIFYCLFFFLYTVHDPLNLLLYKSCDLPLENSLCKRKKQRGGEGAGAEALEARRCGPGLRALA